MGLMWKTAAGIFLLDQITKWFAVQWMDLKNLGSIDFWPPYISFRMAWNQGINFGLFAGSGEFTRWVLIVVAVAISGLVVWWVRSEKDNTFAKIFGGILIGGAVGNIVDRLYYGAVADFLNMSCCGFENPYVFNVADIAIFVGAIGLVIFTGGKDKQPPAKGKTG